MNLDWRSVSRGLLLITLGVVFLLINLGMLPWTFWLDLGYWWPVLLVVLGLGVLVRGRVPFSFVLLVTLLVVLALSLTGWGTSLQTRFTTSGPVTRFVESYALPAGTSSARVEVNAGAVNLNLDGAASGLADVDLTHPTAWGAGLNVRSDSGSSGRVTFRIEQSGWSGFAAPGTGTRINNWTVHLTNQVPVDLRVNAGAVKGELDLSQIRLKALDLNGGAGDVRVRFGRPEGKVPVSVDAAASHVVLAVPSGVPVRVETKGVLGSTQGLSDLTEGAGDGAVATPGYSASDSGLDIAIHGALSNVRLERY
ncbi:MAG: LiaI-LiaF-like domain-containing protein [Bacillota bacterium]